MHGKRNTSLLWPNSAREGSLCGGPVTSDYEPVDDFHAIEFVLQVDDGSGSGK